MKPSFSLLLSFECPVREALSSLEVSHHRHFFPPPGPAAQATSLWSQEPTSLCLNPNPPQGMAVRWQPESCKAGTFSVGLVAILRDGTIGRREEEEPTPAALVVMEVGWLVEVAVGPAFHVRLLLSFLNYFYVEPQFFSPLALQSCPPPSSEEQQCGMELLAGAWSMAWLHHGCPRPADPGQPQSTRIEVLHHSYLHPHTVLRAPVGTLTVCTPEQDPGLGFDPALGRWAALGAGLRLPLAVLPSPLPCCRVLGVPHSDCSRATGPAEHSWCQSSSDSVHHFLLQVHILWFRDSIFEEEYTSSHLLMCSLELFRTI